MGAGLAIGFVLLSSFIVTAVGSKKDKPIPPKEIPEDIEIKRNNSQEFMTFFD